MASGLTINNEKSNLFPLGPLIHTTPAFLKDHNLKLNYGPVCILGVYFTHNGDELFRLNFLPKLSRLKNCLRLWSSRDITPIGRNIIVKTFALSQLVYLFLTLPNPPDHFIKELQDIIFDFIWAGNPDKVKRVSMFNDVSKGGFKVTHVKSFMYSLKCTWARRYCDDSFRPWKLFFDLALRKYGKKLVFSCNCKKLDVLISNNFISQVVHAWCDAYPL